MTELFDMGKYDFYVWGSIIFFLMAIVADYFSAKMKVKQIKKIIKTKAKKQNIRRSQS